MVDRPPEPEPPPDFDGLMTAAEFIQMVDALVTGVPDRFLFILAAACAAERHKRAEAKARAFRDAGPLAARARRARALRKKGKGADGGV